MQNNAESIFQAALQLPESDRLALVSRLIDTLPPDLSSLDDPQFLEELARRFADDTGAIAWPQLHAEG